MSGTPSPLGVLPSLGVVVAAAATVPGVVAPDPSVVGPAVPASPVVPVVSSSSPPHAVITTPAASARAVRLLNRCIFQFPQVDRWRPLVATGGRSIGGHSDPTARLGQRCPRDPPPKRGGTQHLEAVGRAVSPSKRLAVP